jgi:hypothetical protein
MSKESMTLISHDVVVDILLKGVGPVEMGQNHDSWVTEAAH